MSEKLDVLHKKTPERNFDSNCFVSYITAEKHFKVSVRGL